jgi:hypothetical protein
MTKAAMDRFIYPPGFFNVLLETNAKSMPGLASAA